MKIIGITGKSGSGKTTFSTMLASKLNCQFIDIDKIGHNAIYSPEIAEKLFKEFGKGISDGDGIVNRKKLGAIVFSSKSQMDKLTDLTWNFMQKEVDSILEKNPQVIILDWILLPNSKYWEKCDYKILITSNAEDRKNKVLERDKISPEYFDKRDSASLDYSNCKFDFIFENDYQHYTIENIINHLNINF